MQSCEVWPPENHQSPTALTDPKVLTCSVDEDDEGVRRRAVLTCGADEGVRRRAVCSSGM